MEHQTSLQEATALPDREMADEIIARAVAREAELRAELEQIQVFLSVYRKLAATQFQDTSTSPVGAGVTERTATEGDLISTGTDINIPPQGMRQVEFVPFVRAMILERGRPMQPREILAAFKKKGRHVGGTNEFENLKSKLWRARHTIVNIGGSGWWPSDVPCPQVSYVPPSGTSDEDRS